MTEFDINSENTREEENSAEQVSENPTEENVKAEQPAEQAEQAPVEAAAKEQAPKISPEPEPAPQYQAGPQYYAPQYSQQEPQYRRPEPYAQAPSQGYYRPDTNEYIYSAKPPKKKSGFGKGLLIAITCILSAFVISIGSITAYNYYAVKSGRLVRENIIADQRGKPLDGSGDVEIDDHRNDEDEEQSAAQIHNQPATESDDDDENEQHGSTVPTVIRDFPNLEQVAAPDDAMKIPDIYDKVSPSVVGVSCSVRGGTQVGTGFVISEDGYIVTNAHVISNYISVMIVDSDMNEYEAEVIGSDEITDIAVLKIDPEDTDLVPVEFGKSSELRIGELAIAIGNPLGFELYGTMSTGIISGLNRTVTVEDNTMNLIQTSATINNGNSGGPLLDAYGRVIGITSAKVDTTYGEGLGFAIPIDEALPIIESLIRYGYIPGRPSIGITGQDINELMSLYYRMPRGIYVFAVTEDSGAEKAGIVAGDIIIAAEGESVETSDQLNDIKNRYQVGDTITLTIYRGGKNFDVDVTLGESTPGDAPERTME